MGPWSLSWTQILNLLPLAKDLGPVPSLNPGLSIWVVLLQCRLMACLDYTTHLKCSAICPKKPLTNGGEFYAGFTLASTGEATLPKQKMLGAALMKVQGPQYGR